MLTPTKWLAFRGNIMQVEYNGMRLHWYNLISACYGEWEEKPGAFRYLTQLQFFKNILLFPLYVFCNN